MTSQSQVDLVLVNPANQSQIYQNLASTFSAIEPPVWALIMAAFVRRHGYSVRVIDACAEGWGAEEVAREIAATNPVLTAVVVYGQQPSASTQVMPGARAVCLALKQLAPELKVLLLGGHVASLPERTLQEEKADYVATGEGLYTLTDLLAALKSGGDDLAKVRGLCYRDNGKARFTPPAILLQNLDQEIPGLPWDLLPMKKYRAHNWHCLDTLKRNPYASMYTTLGCPFHCAFCCIQAPFKEGEQEAGMRKTTNSYRMWSPEWVIAQLEILVTQYGVRNVKVADEMFVLNPRHVLRICELISERGYDLNFWAYARVDTVKDGMLDKLKKAGFNWLAFGIEAADARVRDMVQKGFEQEDIARTLDNVRAADINIIGNYIFGLPEDDHKTVQATLDMAMELNCEFANFYSAMAYPGSELYRIALKEGWELPSSWSGYSQHAMDTLPLRTKYLTSAAVLKFRDEAFQTYYRNPRYLELVRRKFGAETVRHIEEMVSHKLQRNLLTAQR
jgi:anaerobic magnesium-protoporphyrin IX monomethyl ester cyclase